MRNATEKKDLEAAVAAIRATQIAHEITGEVPSEFNGYISSFGAAVVQSGLLPAVIFFEDQGAASKERQKLMEAIGQMLATNGQKLSQYLLTANRDLVQARRDVLRCAVALKLALRLFKKSASDV